MIRGSIEGARRHRVVPAATLAMTFDFTDAAREEPHAALPVSGRQNRLRPTLSL
jgi:hypothetical protein